MHADQTVISLRPGGGPSSTRFFTPCFESSSSSSSSSDSQILRPAFKAGNLRFQGHECIQYMHEQLSQLKEVADIPEGILKIKQEVDSEFAGNDQIWGHADGNISLQSQPQSRYSESDNHYWRGQSTAPGDERSWDTIRDNKEVSSWSDSRPQEMNNHQEQLNSQFARAQISSSQGVGPTPVLVKAEVPWTARRGSLSENERVLKTVKGILNKLTPEKFDVLKGCYLTAV